MPVSSRPSGSPRSGSGSSSASTARTFRLVSGGSRRTKSAVAGSSTTRGLGTTCGHLLSDEIAQFVSAALAAIERMSVAQNLRVELRVGHDLELRQDPQEVRQQDAVHPAVAHDEDRLAGALAHQPLDDAKDTGDDPVERFASRPRDEAIVGPVRQPADLVEGLAGALADVDLPQLW